MSSGPSRPLRQRSRQHPRRELISRRLAPPAPTNHPATARLRPSPARLRTIADADPTTPVGPYSIAPRAILDTLTSRARSASLRSAVARRRPP